jgi:hypothetical protein
MLQAEDESAQGMSQKSSSFSLFAEHKLAPIYLPRALLTFFVDIEFTGSHTQFYDKFEYRSLISQILERLWRRPAYKQHIIQVRPAYKQHIIQVLAGHHTYSTLLITHPFFHHSSILPSPTMRSLVRDECGGE